MDRYLNMPPARLPAVDPHAGEPDGLLDELPRLLHRQQQVDESAVLVSQYLAAGGGPAALLGVIGACCSGRTEISIRSRWLRRGFGSTVC
jgi:hypothetical protein